MLTRGRTKEKHTNRRTCTHDWSQEHRSSLKVYMSQADRKQKTGERRGKEGEKCGGKGRAAIARAQERARTKGEEIISRPPFDPVRKTTILALGGTHTSCQGTTGRQTPRFLPPLRPPLPLRLPLLQQPPPLLSFRNSLCSPRESKPSLTPRPGWQSPPPWMQEPSSQEEEGRRRPPFATAAVRGIHTSSWSWATRRPLGPGSLHWLCRGESHTPHRNSAKGSHTRTERQSLEGGVAGGKEGSGDVGKQKHTRGDHGHCSHVHGIARH